MNRKKGIEEQILVATAKAVTLGLGKVGQTELEIMIMLEDSPLLLS